MKLAKKIILFIITINVLFSCIKEKKNGLNDNVRVEILSDSNLNGDFSYKKLLVKEGFIKQDVFFLNKELNVDFGDYTKSTYEVKQFDLKFENLSYKDTEVRNIYFKNEKIKKRAIKFGDSVNFNFKEILPYTYDETTEFYINKNLNYFLLIDIPDNSVGLFTSKYQFYQLIDVDNKLCYEFYMHYSNY